MSIDEAKEHGLQLIPKWAPVLAVILIPVGWLGQGAVNYVTQGSQLSQVRLDIASLNARIDAINAERELRHEVYEQNLRDSKATEAALLATVKQYGDQLDRIEGRVDDLPAR